MNSITSFDDAINIVYGENTWIGQEKYVQLVLTFANFNYKKMTKVNCEILNNGIKNAVSWYINSLPRDEKMWEIIESKHEYSYYKLKRRMWPVLPTHNQEWRDRAKAINIKNGDYPGGLADAKNTDAKQKDPEYKHEDRDDEIDVDDEIDDADTVKQLGTFQNTMTKETKLLIERLSASKKEKERTEKINKLKDLTNYGLYTIPPLVEQKKVSNSVVEKVMSLLMMCDMTKTAIEYSCSLLICRRYFQAVIKNPPVMRQVGKIMKSIPSSASIFSYAMRYAFIMLNKEERLLGRRETHGNRSVMTGEQMRALPIFKGFPDRGPYVQEVIGKKTLMSSVLMCLKSDRSITDRKEMLRRMSVVYDGLCDGIDFSRYNAAITGSSIIPCVVKIDALEKRHKTFKDYVEFHYPSYQSLTVLRDDFERCKELAQSYVAENNVVMPDFKYPSDKIIALREQRRKNGENFVDVQWENLSTIDHFLISYSYLRDDHYDIDEICERVEEINDKIEDAESHIADVDIAISVKCRETYEKYAFEIFEQVKKNAEKRGNYDRIYLHKAQLKYGFKYVIKGEGVKRPMDLFMIVVPFPQLLYRYHLNIPRFCWDGKQLMGLSSAVCAAMTGINQWRNWFSNNKDPVDVCLKYISRGFTIILNTKEIVFVEMYISEIEKYKLANEFVSPGMFSENHTVFGNSFGARYFFSDMNKITPSGVKYDGSVFWPNEKYKIGTVSLLHSKEGYLIAPRLGTLRDAICQL